MKQEIERRWLINSLPDFWCIFHAKVTQSYVSASPEVRLRAITNITEFNRDDLRDEKPYDNYQLTIKQGSGLVRQEHEICLTKEQYEELEPSTKNTIVKDFRIYETPSGINMVVSVINTKVPLILAEIEFPNEESALQFDPIEFSELIVEEVTHNNKFNMRNLAEQIHAMELADKSWEENHG